MLITVAWGWGLPPLELCSGNSGISMGFESYFLEYNVGLSSFWEMLLESCWTVSAGSRGLATPRLQIKSAYSGINSAC